MVRPKTHTRESSRGMLTLTEEEASRRSGGSPAQSPCHSLPSGGPRRRESEPIGPQRPVRGTANHRRAQLSSGALAGRRRGVELLYHWPVTGGRSAAAAPPHLPASQHEDKSSTVTEIQQEESARTCRFTRTRSGGPRWSLRVHLRTTSSVLLMVGLLDPAGFVLLLSVKTTAPPCPVHKSSRCRPSLRQQGALLSSTSRRLTLKALWEFDFAEDSGTDLLQLRSVGGAAVSPSPSGLRLFHRFTFGSFYFENIENIVLL